MLTPHKYILSSVLFFASGVCLAQTSFLNPGAYNLTIPEAPGSPYPPLQNFNQSLTSQGDGANFPVPASRFPIIPQDVFTRFFNAVASDNQLRQLNNVFSAYAGQFRFYAANNGVDCSVTQTSNDIVNASNLAMARGTNWIREGGTRVPNGLATFAAYFAATPGNFYIGPSNRSDLPAAGNIDFTARAVVGDRYWNEKSILFNLMGEYIRTRNATILSSINSLMVSFAEETTVVRLTASHWQLSNGQYRINPNLPIPSNEDSNQSKNISPGNAQLCNQLFPTFSQQRLAFIALMRRR